MWPPRNPFPSDHNFAEHFTRVPLDDLNRRMEAFAQAKAVGVTTEPMGAVTLRALELARQAPADADIAIVVDDMTENIPALAHISMLLPCPYVRCRTVPMLADR